MANELQMVMQAIKELGNNINALNGRIGKLEIKMDTLEQRMDRMEQEMHSGFSALKQEIKEKHFDVLIALIFCVRMP